MIVKFNYTNKKGEMKSRRVFVVKDTNSFIEGLDLTLLTRSECYQIRKKFGKLNPSHSEEKSNSKIDGWDSTWNRAWRKFNKINIM